MRTDILNKIKPIDEISKLDTNRLLSYYKARRQDRINLIIENTCDCCGELSWVSDPTNQSCLDDKQVIDDLGIHLKGVKVLLNQREHVVKEKKKKR